MAKVPPPAPKTTAPAPKAPAAPAPGPTPAGDAAPKAPPLPPALKEDAGLRTGTPKHRVWIQPQYGDTLLPADAFEEKEPLIHIGGIPYRHVADHPDDGAWMYRSS